jgi:hypothetical protein
MLSEAKAAFQPGAGDDEVRRGTSIEVGDDAPVDEEKGKHLEQIEASSTKKLGGWP